MSKDGSIWQLFVLLFTKVWHTPGQEKVATPALILEGFTQTEGQKTFHNWVKNTILPNRLVFTPHRGIGHLFSLFRSPFGNYIVTFLDVFGYF